MAHLFQEILLASENKKVACGFLGGLTTLALLKWCFRPQRDKRAKMVLVTGSAQGLGRAISLALIRHGDFVVGSDIDVDGLKELEREYPTRFLALPMDVSSPSSVSDAADRLLKFSGKPCLDSIVNNAGIIRGGPLIELEDKDMAAILNVNVMGPFYVTKYFFRLLKRKNDESSYRARIVNFGSEVSYAGVSAMFNAPYAMTKFSIEAYTTALRQELGVLSEPVHVIIMNPGAHDTNMTSLETKPIGRTDKPGSLYQAHLKIGEVRAGNYIREHKKPAGDVGEAVADVIHQLNPPKRVKINVSWEMSFAKYTPQSILDAATRLLMSNSI